MEENMFKDTKLPQACWDVLDRLESTGILITLDVDAHGTVVRGHEGLCALVNKSIKPSDSLFEAVTDEDRQTLELLLQEAFDADSCRNSLLSFASDSTDKPIRCHVIATPWEPTAAPESSHFSAYKDEDADDRHRCVRLFVIPNFGSEASNIDLQAHKLVNIGALSAGIAHDLNNLFAGMRTYLALIKGEAQEQYIQGLEDTLQRATHLSNTIVSYFKDEEERPDAIHPEACIRKLTHFATRTLDARIKVTLKVPETSHPVFVTQSELSQLLLNLIINARDAIEGQGEIKLEYSYEQRHGQRFFVLKIADTGCGIPQEDLDKIFRPFFSSKAPDKGTGLGLAIVHKIVKDAGGHIDVDSTPGLGSCFTILLPTI